jgi:UDP-N-acetylmuramate--alanine ligase
VFQPHQHSRTRFLLGQFAGSFDDADVLVFPDIYFVRDSEVEKRRISSADLAREVSDRGKEALYIPTFDEIVSSLRKRLEPGDVVITMGAGNIGELGHGMAQEFVEACAEG